MIKFRAWYMPFGKYGAMQEMVYSRASHILALAETEPEKYIPEQFTGLKDVNGNEIYEGDVLRLSYYEPKTYIYNDKDNLKPEIIAPKKVTRTAQVTKDAGTFVVSIYKVVFMTLRDVDKGRQNVEVIGNVHANPELLEEDK
ncbi:YopX family protein [Lactiplantibacillus plantarum]|uniref:YopX family protein n=1 Tax=Lactiplantibacillus plantarum TaxID=1590 RepID=UPI003C1E7DCD